ncbi:11849_t:CDS:2 [Diversispora eburnea]|uniref:11849_t:CDS:1 n=1 Tax=Diversispora eburnea TaxID=1213867 RepID=A0A9N8ZXH6_9GLOM|nr:11849_t:CDS:2 [Diversispora eburnea]
MKKEDEAKSFNGDILPSATYAKDGDLRAYLQTNFKRLDWIMKINMAKDIISGLSCIHEENIVHKDLVTFEEHLVHEGRLLITDLGLFQSSDANSNSTAAPDIYSLGMLFWELSSGRPPFNNIPSFEIYKKVISGEREKLNNETPKDYINIYLKYLDPMLLRRLGKCSKTKASDIYSIVILLWKISSEKIQYESKFQNELDLINYISRGNREDPIIGTPQDYINIYQDCWNQDQNQCPNIGEVIRDFEYVDFENNFVELIE